jgi:hypothetical protein
MEQMALPAQREQQVQQDLPAQQVFRDPPEAMEQMALQDLLALPEQPVRVLRAPPAQRVITAPPE